MIRRLLTLSVLLAAAAAPAFSSGGEQGDWELGLFAGNGFPDGYGSGTSKLNPDDDVLYGFRFGYFYTPTLSLEASLQQFSGRETRFHPSSGASDVDFDINSVRINILRNFRAGRMFRPFLTAGAGMENTDVDNRLDENDLGINLGGGLRWFAGERFGIRVDARYVLTDVDEVLDKRQDNLEGTLGVLWAFGGRPPADTDGDGVVDRRDKCPDTPRGATVDERGCPTDSDNDGVPDGLDKCPKTPEGVAVDHSGCPKDSDGDGVHDGLDKCPKTPRGAKVDASGCPTDSDGDGVHDGIDKCPNTPRGAKVDASGCPTDSDGDGVHDGIDKCPNTPRGAKVDTAGCPMDSDGDGVHDGIDKCPGTPKGTKVDDKGCRILFTEKRATLILEGVNFDFNSDRLTPAAMAILDRVALSLKQWPGVRVEVAGHTDSLGSDAYNLTLSEKRARAVRSYLAEKGADGSRLTSKGYGESKPIADNSTKAGRDRNRRVELKKLN